MSVHQKITRPAAHNRADRHALIRATGHGDKLDRLIGMLGKHRTDLNEIVSLSANPPSHVAATILAPLGRRAKDMLHRIEATLDNPQIGDSPYGSLGGWGENGTGARIADMLRTARFHSDPLTELRAGSLEMAPTSQFGMGRFA